jgi:protein SCO1/2
MSRRIPLAAILLLGPLLLWLLLFWNPSPDRTQTHDQLELQAAPVGGEFELISAQGPVKLSDLRGKLVLLYFGYTACPDICPTNLAILALALRQLSSAELERVQVLFVSVDAERDTPERLADYGRYFHPSIMGLTGAPAGLAAVAKQYGAAYRRSDAADSAMGYSIDHSAYSYLIDQSGRLVEVLDHATPAEEIISLLRRYLAASGQVEGG